MSHVDCFSHGVWTKNGAVGDILGQLYIINLFGLQIEHMVYKLIIYLA